MRQTSRRIPKLAPPPPSVRGALITALVLYFVIEHWVPFGHELLYPLTLLATWVHEMGHGVTALACGGQFLSLDVFADASGLARTTTAAAWQQGLVAAGGLVAPPVVGALLLALSRGPKRARVLLAALASAILASVAVWVRSATGLIALPIVALVLSLFITNKIGTPERRLLLAQFLGVVLAIDTVTRIDYLFKSEVRINGTVIPSDIASVAHSLGGPSLLWGLALAAFSLLFLAAGLFAAWRAG